MRLKSVYISQYKNLKDFTLTFDGSSFIDVFVGKNGTGKSNLFEVLIDIFHHIYNSRRKKAALSFNYRLNYEVDNTEIEIEWDTRVFTINGVTRKTIGNTQLPDNVLIYYSGHNKTVTRLVKKYELAFRRRIKKVNPEEARYFLGIGPDYKELLLATLLMQPNNNTAREYICTKLGISSTGDTAALVLRRHLFADKKFIVENFEPTTHFWGLKGVARSFLDDLIRCVKGEFNLSDLYNPAKDAYNIPINIELFRNSNAWDNSAHVFRQFDNLKTLGMITELSIPLQLTNGLDANITHFSDGQFQSVYIYSIVELFKDRNCITLLDEPDSFLHPEWQFGFLKQVFEISDTASKKNHVLMSSHNPSTITNIDDQFINILEVHDSKVKTKRASKREVIKSLSNGLIQYSEDQSLLRIDNVIRTCDKPLLFVEGPSDVLILETAFSKLYPTEEIPFLIQDAFDRGFIKVLLSRNEMFSKYPQKTFFALFDFDDAYEDWRCMKGEYVIDDVTKGLCKELKGKKAFAFLLPVPENKIKDQVLNDQNPIEKVISNPHMGIEHIFWGVFGTENYFKTKESQGCQRIHFKGDSHKIKFAEEVIPTIPLESFLIFKPMFEFIKSKC